MATKREIIRWNLYSFKKRVMYAYGIVNGLIKIYDKELLDKLRNVCVGGLPASFVLLAAGYVQGFCYDRAWLVTMGFDENDDFELVYAAQSDLSLNPKYIDEVRDASPEEKREHAEHCYAVRTDKNGVRWVYDTSLGLIFEESFYNKMENPVIRHKNSKEKTMDYFEYQAIKNSSFEENKYSLPLLVPFARNLGAAQPFYQGMLEEELNRFLVDIDYEGVCAEIDADMRAKGFRKGLELK